MEKKEQVPLKIEKSTATQFKEQTRKWNISQSQSLQLMLDFFTRHGMSPNEDLRPNMKALENRLLKQLDTLRAILFKMEQSQIRPTHAMLQNLLQGQTSKRAILVEKKQHHPSEDSSTHNPRNESDSYMDQRDKEAFNELKRLFNITHITKDQDGWVRLRITLTQACYDHLQNKLKSTDHVC